VVAEGASDGFDVTDALGAAGANARRGLAGAIAHARNRRLPLGELLDELARASGRPVVVDAERGRLVGDHAPAPAPPICPPEVWGAGVTYMKSRTAREAESAVAADVYALVYDAPRPEIFLKDAGGRRTAGPGEPIAIRADSASTVPEAELALILDGDGRIVALTLANDVTARDIEAENPLYLPQAKIYAGSCALGPCALIWTDAAGVLPEFELAVTVEGPDGGTLFESSTTTASLRRTPAELAAAVCESNVVDDGTVLMTGTGMVPPEDFTLAAGQVVRIACPQIGTLANPVLRHERRDMGFATATAGRGRVA
jgi:2-dehydro-3-deoxy-D-arabinonate dehydratase